MQSGEKAPLEEALALHHVGKLQEAAAKYREFLGANPSHFEAWHHLGLALAQGGELATARDALLKALEIAPDSADACFNLGVLLQTMGRHGEAVPYYLKILASTPASPPVLLNLGNAYLSLARFDEAAAAYRQAAALDPRSALADNNLGLALEKLGKGDEAAAAYEAASRIDARYVDPLLNLAQLRLAAGRLAEPSRLLKQALALQPGLTESRRCLAQIYSVCGAIEEAVGEREFVIRSAPPRSELYRDLITDLNFADGDDGRRVAAACQTWHQKFAAGLADRAPPFPNDRNPDRPLRVGYVGGSQFRTHTLAVTVLPLVETHDRREVELYCYSDLPPEQEDHITARFKRAMAWRSTHQLSDADFTSAIRRDQIDILLDPVGFSPGSRLLALARRPAPIQISFPMMGPCGGATIDYVIADDRLLPPQAEKFYTEKILRIPFAHCYRPTLEPPPIRVLPAAQSGVVTFGSMNVLPKVGRRAIRAWSRILQSVGNSRLLVKAGFPFRDPDVRKAFLARLAEQGIGAERVTLMEWSPDYRGHMDVYNAIDIALDSFPYCGVTTTYEALSMGVPVVTLAGARVLDRYASDILGTVGFDDGIASTEDDYVARAVDLASDIERLRKLRSSLRERLFASPACDATRFARSIETVLRSAWRDWCARGVSRADDLG